MAMTFLKMGIIYFLGHFFAFTFRKFKVPDVFLFMCLGLLFGPVLSLVSPEDFGNAGPIFSTLALIVILFESGTTLNMKSLAQAAGKGTALTILTFLVTATLVFLLSLPFTGSTELSVLAGLILGGTSSAVVIPMASALGIKDHFKNVLILESSLTDVLCIVLTLAAIQAFSGGTFQFGAITLQILLSFSVALFVGVIAGFLWSILKKRIQAQFATIAFVITVYSLVELVGLSGPIAVMSLGAALANSHRLKRQSTESQSLTESEFNFYSELVFILKTFFFIYLGISMKFQNWVVLPVATLLVFGLIFVRSVMMHFLFPSATSRKEKMFVTLLIPKGLAAAVLASLPFQKGLDPTEMIPQFVYPTVFVSILLVSLLIPVADKKFAD